MAMRTATHCCMWGALPVCMIVSRGRAMSSCTHTIASNLPIANNLVPSLTNGHRLDSLAHMPL